MGAIPFCCSGTQWQSSMVPKCPVHKRRRQIVLAPSSPVAEMVSTEMVAPKLLRQNVLFWFLPESSTSQPVQVHHDHWQWLQVTSLKGHWSDIYIECNYQVNIIIITFYHMIDVSGDSVKQSQHVLTLTLNPNPVTLQTCDLPD